MESCQACEAEVKAYHFFHPEKNCRTLVTYVSDAFVFHLCLVAVTDPARMLDSKRHGCKGSPTRAFDRLVMQQKAGRAMRAVLSQLGFLD